jgi:type IV secretory pathway protease TraF
MNVVKYYKNHKKSFVGLLFLIGLLFVPILKPINPVLYFNWTPSVPKGIYVPIKGDIQIGDYVIINVENIYDPNHLRLPERLVKKIIGCPGDTIYSYLNKLIVNDMSIFKAHEYPFFFEETQVIDKEQYFLSGLSKRSYDSRYFGTVSGKHLKRVKLIWRF